MLKKFCGSCGQKTSAGCGCKGSAENTKESCGYKNSASDEDTQEFEPNKEAYNKAVKELRTIANLVYNTNKHASLQLRKIAMRINSL